MQILKSLSMRDKQTIKNTLIKFVEYGYDINRTIEILVSEEKEHHTRIENEPKVVNEKTKKIQLSPCTEPGCKGVMIPQVWQDLDDSKVVNLKCNKCQYSELMNKIYLDTKTQDGE